MAKRRFLLFNPINYRLKRVFFLITGIVICNYIVLAVLVLYIQTDTITKEESIRELTETIAVENNIVESFLLYAGKSKLKGLKLASTKIKDDHTLGMQKIHKHISELKKQSERNRIFLTTAVALIFIFSVGIYGTIIHVMSKISGPIYLMADKMKAVLEGNTPEFRPLRDGDELKEFYSDFIKIIENKK